MLLAATCCNMYTCTLSQLRNLLQQCASVHAAAKELKINDNDDIMMKLSGLHNAVHNHVSDTVICVSPDGFCRLYVSLEPSKYLMIPKH